MVLSGSALICSIEMSTVYEYHTTVLYIAKDIILWDVIITVCEWRCIVYCPCFWTFSLVYLPGSTFTHHGSNISPFPNPNPSMRGKWQVWLFFSLMMSLNRIKKYCQNSEKTIWKTYFRRCKNFKIKFFSGAAPLELLDEGGLQCLSHSPNPLTPHLENLQGLLVPF